LRLRAIIDFLAIVARQGRFCACQQASCRATDIHPRKPPKQFCGSMDRVLFLVKLAKHPVKLAKQARKWLGPIRQPASSSGHGRSRPDRGPTCAAEDAGARTQPPNGRLTSWGQTRPRHLSAKAISRARARARACRPTAPAWPASKSTISRKGPPSVRSRSRKIHFAGSQ